MLLGLFGPLPILGGGRLLPLLAQQTREPFLLAFRPWSGGDGGAANVVVGVRRALVDDGGIFFIHDLVVRRRGNGGRMLSLASCILRLDLPRRRWSGISLPPPIGARTATGGIHVVAIGIVLYSFVEIYKSQNMNRKMAFNL